MKLSEFIQECQHLLSVHGDLEFVDIDYDEYPYVYYFTKPKRVYLSELDNYYYVADWYEKIIIDQSQNRDK